MPPEQPPIILTAPQAILILVLIFALPVGLLFGGSHSLPKMLFDSLGLSFLWNKSTDDEALSYEKRRPRRKKNSRSGAEQALTVSEGVWFLAHIYSPLMDIKPLPNLQSITRDWSTYLELIAS